MTGREKIEQDRNGQTAYGQQTYTDLAIDQLERNNLPLTGSPTLEGR